MDATFQFYLNFYEFLTFSHAVRQIICFFLLSFYILICWAIPFHLWVLRSSQYMCEANYEVQGFFQLSLFRSSVLEAHSVIHELDFG